MYTVYIYIYSMYTIYMVLANFTHLLSVVTQSSPLCLRVPVAGTTSKVSFICKNSKRARLTSAYTHTHIRTLHRRTHSHTRARTHTHTHAHACSYTRTHAHTHTHMHMCTRTHTRAHTHTRTRAQITYTRAHTCYNHLITIRPQIFEGCLSHPSRVFAHTAHARTNTHTCK